MRACYDDISSNTERFNNSNIMKRFAKEKMYEMFVSHIHDEEANDIEDWLMGLEDDEVVEHE